MRPTSSTSTRRTPSSRGPTGTGARYRRSARSIPTFRVEPERYIDAGDDVVVIGTARGTAASGVTVQWRQGYIWTIRTGRAVVFRWFNDPAEALEAVGLAD